MPSSEEAGTWEGIGATGVKVVRLDWHRQAREWGRRV